MAIWNKVQIISLTLGWLGKGPITDLSTLGDTGAILSNAYDLIFPNELSKYNWRFATAIVQLAQVVPVPLLNSWKYAYELPANYLALWKFHPKGMPYNIYENRLIYTNAPTVKIEYRYLPSESRLPQYFVDYLSLKLAAKTALQITQNNKFSDDIKKEAQVSLVEALAADAQSHPNESTVDNPFVNGRF